MLEGALHQQLGLLDCRTRSAAEELSVLGRPLNLSDSESAPRGQQRGK